MAADANARISFSRDSMAHSVLGFDKSNPIVAAATVATV